jgi:hypothetical protein
MGHDHVDDTDMHVVCRVIAYAQYGDELENVLILWDAARKRVHRDSRKQARRVLQHFWKTIGRICNDYNGHKFFQSNKNFTNSGFRMSV